MAQTTRSDFGEWTALDLVQRFGAIPLHRIRRTPPPGAATERDVIEIREHEDRLCELVDGVLVEKATGEYEAYLGSLLTYLLWAFVRPRKLGVVLSSDAMIRLAPGLVRIPDVSFFSWEERKRDITDFIRLGGSQDQGRPLQLQFCFARLSPHLPKLKREPAEKRFAGKALRIFHDGDRCAWLINVHALLKRIDQPAELGPVGHVFVHLGLQILQIVGGRTELDDEIRTQRRKRLLLFLRQPIPPRSTHPGRVRRSLGAVRKNESRGRVEGHSGAVGLGPAPQTDAQFEVQSTVRSSPREGGRRRERTDGRLAIQA